MQNRYTLLTEMTHFSTLNRNSNAVECAHFIDDLAAARDNFRLQIPADAIIGIITVP